ncbi:MAG TPA: hypothetical protein PLF00_06920 [Candidatus Marinimicrobia bacterium]|jgi:hypothetical protein|nr:hypothetical protein [Candidatus Neomarinimicrobiota bacterium]
MANYYTLNKNISTRRTTSPTEETPPSPAVKIDFSDTEQRYEYIRSKLDDIMENIGQCYSERLTKELLHRLEKTILDFHTEVIALLDKLEKLEIERRQLPERTPVPESVSAPVESQSSERAKRIEESEQRKAGIVIESELKKNRK